MTLGRGDTPAHMRADSTKAGAVGGPKEPRPDPKIQGARSRQNRASETDRVVTVARIYIPFLAAIPLRYDVTDATDATDRATLA